MHEGDELTDLQTFFLSLLRAGDETVFVESGRVSLGDRFVGFEGEANRGFEESELLEPRHGKLIVSLVILIDIFEVIDDFPERIGLIGTIVGFIVRFDWFCFLTDESDAFDTFGLLLALIKGEPLQLTAYLDTLSNMMENLKSDLIKK